MKAAMILSLLILAPSGYAASAAPSDSYFDIDVVSVRDASAEELEHGHVHGVGGHHH